ncbi:XRE family transcriptional regulator [Spongiactinospora rosea]|uniref:XRE family transcriptional regulator n=1 Tax=Spongiactinospora rosea TaxID=2248750 RepID=A0A366M596_9ACTN|nr:helix-turn-helix domain-containing protein [Spongiactinospora rosea]RBQ21428.1 XRE family transcriptional regulator [Spongiactinospora rosea]
MGLDPVWGVFGGAMRRHRERRGLRVRDIGDAAHVHFSLVSRWEGGINRPTASAARLVDECLGCDGELIAMHADTVASERRRKGTTPDGSPIDDEGDEMERRTAIQLIATAGAVIPLADLEQSLTAMDHILDTRIDLDDWERTVHEYGYQFVRRPVGALAADLTAEITAVSHLLNQGNAPRIQAGLLRVAAELSSLLATDLHDSGQARVARHVWRAARRSADASGDQELSVYVRAKEADDLWWAGSSPHAVRELADQAVHRAGGTPSYGILRAHIVRCRLAADGHGGEARTALRAFSETFERLPPGGHGRPEDALGEAWLHWHEAHLLTMIGDDQAQDVFDQALARYSADTPGTVSLLQLIRALDLVRRREIDDGLTHAVTTLQTGAMSTARRFVANKITKALPQQARTHPHATELRRLITPA